MPFSFLAPIFLVGLAALAIPVLIHLSNRPKKEVVRFPSLMFIDRVEVRDASKRRLRNLFLFALRALALILLAAAFARPYLDRPDAPAVAIDGGREVVVLVDRSASMGIGDRMARAREAAAEVARGLRRGDRATVVAFDHDATALGRATDQAAALTAAVDTIRPGDGGTRLAPALRLAESILDGSPLPQRELIIISDFPRSAWEPDAGVTTPARTAVRTVDVAAGERGDVGGDVRADVGVVDASFTRDRFEGRERVRTSARLMNHGDAAAEVTATLTLDGRVHGTRTVSVPAGAGAVATFDAVTLPDHAVRGVVRIDDDAVPFDDAFHFTLAADRGPRVRVVAPRGGGGPAGLYLARALEAGAVHETAAVAASDLTAGLAAADVVVLNDADPTSDDVARGLRSWIEAGGGLVVVLGERFRGGRLEGLLPGTLEGTRDRAGDGGGVIASLELQHPLFAAFRGAGGGAITSARFFRYREFRPSPGATVLARYDDGAPALVAAEVGRGRVVVMTTPLDGTWSDLVLLPSFVPLIHGVVGHAAGLEPAPAWRTVGDRLDVGPLLADRDGTGSGSAPVVVPPEGPPIPIASRGDEAPTMLPLEARGFYQLRDPRAAGSAPVVAVNIDPAESERARVDPEEVRSALISREAAQPLVSGAPTDRERRQSLWWWILAATFVIMVAETLLGNTLSRRGRPAVARGERS